jgi:hypothetical protein
LQTALRAHSAHLIFYAFDLLHLDGNNLRDIPLVERRAKLQAFLGTDIESPLQFSEEFIGDAAAFFRRLLSDGLPVGLGSNALRAPCFAVAVWGSMMKRKFSEALATSTIIFAAPTAIMRGRHHAFSGSVNLTDAVLPSG